MEILFLNATRGQYVMLKQYDFNDGYMCMAFDITGREFFLVKKKSSSRRAKGIRPGIVNYSVVLLIITVTRMHIPV